MGRLALGVALIMGFAAVTAAANPTEPKRALGECHEVVLEQFHKELERRGTHGRDPEVGLSWCVPEKKDSNKIRCEGYGRSGLDGFGGATFDLVIEKKMGAQKVCSLSSLKQRPGRFQWEKKSATPAPPVKGPRGRD